VNNVTNADQPPTSNLVRTILSQSSSPAKTALLEVDDLSVQFGGIKALDQVSFKVWPRSVCGLIGPNGAGKTTLVNCVSRIQPPTRGDIRFDGRSVLTHRQYEMARIGVLRTFQNLASFAQLPVWHNVLIGAHCQGRSGYIAALFGSRQQRVEEKEIEARAHLAMERLGLKEHAATPVGQLPAGVQRRVEMARALAASPRLLLLDEPAAGLTPGELEQLAQHIRRLRDEDGMSVMLIEHNMNLVMSVCDELVVLDFGRVIAKGSPDEVREHPEVLRAYLGESA
jgi:branched-chain amino acid transport system ATP-binding protein